MIYFFFFLYFTKCFKKNVKKILTKAYVINIMLVTSEENL